MKTFEQHSNEPKVNDYDYVICQDDDTKLENFLSNNIGQIIGIEVEEEYPYLVYYKNIPSELKSEFVDNWRNFNLPEILFHSPNKKDLDIYTSK
jgi:hypothetical protein